MNQSVPTSPFSDTYIAVENYNAVVAERDRLRAAIEEFLRCSADMDYPHPRTIEHVYRLHGEVEALRAALADPPVREGDRCLTDLGREDLATSALNQEDSHGR